MTTAELGEALNRINALMDEYQEQIPVELYKSITREINKLLFLTLDAVYARYVDDCAQGILAFMKKFNEEE